MSPIYKLTYFNFRGIAEPIRYLLSYGNLEFEDNRITKEEWLELKDKTPFGQIPVLHYDNKQTYQSVAICRFLAKQLKLTGANDWEDLEIDAVVDTFTDLRKKLSMIYTEPDETKKVVLKEEALNGLIPCYLSQWETAIKRNGGYLAIPKLSWADLYVVSMASSLDLFVDGNFFADYPNLKALRDKIEMSPTIQNWIETRPKTVL